MHSEIKLSARSLFVGVHEASTNMIAKNNNGLFFIKIECKC